MSGIRSRDSPARQNTTYENYHNHGLHINTSEGTVNYQTIINNPRPSDPLQELHQRCSPTATFDSGARFDPPRCTESTRLAIIRRIEEWIDSDGVEASLFWLHGGAGVGKSALAQSLSERFQAKNELAASFFFFRSDATRNNGDQLIPTLASQLVNSFKGLDGFVRERIRTSPHLFTKQYQVQMQGLLIEPFCVLKYPQALGSLPPHIVEPFPGIVTRDMQGSWPRLVVIDGLDECQNPDVQCELLRVIAHAIPHIPYPLRFLITSRPESHITRVFDHDRDLQTGMIHRYNLSYDPDADADIRKFLKTEFKEICRVHPLAEYLPRDWPGRKSISGIVERSSGHFIYASTVIKYIRSPKHRPDDRLKVILRLQPPRDQDRPYAQLDALYSFILQVVESPDQLEKICLVLGILYFQSREVGFFGPRGYSNRRIIEWILELRAGDLVLLIDPILSLITIDKSGTVEIFHKSLFDYLLDPSRGGHLPFDLTRVHEVAATHILKKHICANSDFTVTRLRHIVWFTYHCRFGYLNDTLKNYLYSLEVPSDTDLSWNMESNSQLMFNFFDILRRKDFDSTGQYYKWYTAKWANYLNAANKGYLQLLTIQDIQHVKGQCDTLLSKWKPCNFYVTKKRKIPSHAFRLAASIEDEHHIFATFVKASMFHDESDTVVSSLVVGEHFIHSYHFRFKEQNVNRALLLILITYSRHDNTCFLKTCMFVDIISATQLYLMEAEKFFFLNFLDFYGIGVQYHTIL